MNNKKYAIIVIFILTVILVGGIFLITRKNNNTVKVSDVSSVEQIEKKIEEEKKNDETMKLLDASLEKSRESDKDLDGVVDVEEKKLGTDLNNPDTDGDGLLDGDEIKNFQSSPLKADTDGDGFKDGYEVKRGYSPIGSGKLIK